MDGQPRIPYDRTDPMVNMPAPVQGGPGAGAGGPAMLGQLAGGGGVQGPDLAALLPPDAGGMSPGPVMGGGLGGGLEGGAMDAGAGTDALTGQDLAAMGGEVDPEAAEVEELLAALEDPNTPPEMRDQIEQQIAIAARRRMAMGGGDLGA